MLFTFQKMTVHPSLILTKRMKSSYGQFKNGGINQVLEKSGRYHFWTQALRLMKESPISGWGPGGFIRNLDNIRFRYNENPRRKFLDNTNNYYLQMSSELGIIGTSLNIFIITFPLWMVYRIRNQIHNQRERLTVFTCFASLLIMILLFMIGPHIMGLDVLWLFSVFMSFLFVTGIKYGYRFKLKKKIFFVASAVFTLIFLSGTFEHSLGKNGYKAIGHQKWWPYKYDRNCYPLEKWKTGKVRWCSNDAFLQIPIQKTLSDVVKLKIISHHPDIEINPLTVKYGGIKGVDHEVVLSNHSWKTIEISTDSDYIFDFRPPNRPPIKYLVISIDVSRTWIPKKNGIGTDDRKLGVAVLMPHEI
jgi:hypothetical protein